MPKTDFSMRFLEGSDRDHPKQHHYPHEQEEALLELSHLFRRIAENLKGTALGWPHGVPVALQEAKDALDRAYKEFGLSKRKRYKEPRGNVRKCLREE